VTGDVQPSFPRKTVVVAVADHGVAGAGVSAYPSEVTEAMLHNFLNAGAAINVMARAQGASVLVVDAGVLEDVRDAGRAGTGVTAAATRFLSRRIGAGTSDMREGPAMTADQAVEAVVAGIEIVAEQRGRGLDIVATGDMGIGNTTSAAAITAVLAGAEAGAVVGRGTGLDEVGLGRKVAAVEAALATNEPDGSDGLDVLAKVGGYEIGMLAGVILGAAAARIPVILDGYISGAAALLAQSMGPEAITYCVAGHRSSEPGHGVALAQLGLRPYLDLEMRLGEGTGAVLVFALVEASARIMSEMATFAEADVPPRTD
jgi:nicotinate-nucleotide--dimethylbenzimidazole phosphoribosyltransferase